MSFTQSSHSWSKNPRKNLSNPVSERLFDLVMCFGTFDIFHPGHVFYLSEAEKLGEERWSIVIARDARVKKIKWRLPQDTELIRQQNVANTFIEAQVILWDEVDIFAPLREHHPDILVFGYDQTSSRRHHSRKIPTDRDCENAGGFETNKWKSSLLRKIETE
jgi:cytidyltransferase-like protein